MVRRLLSYLLLVCFLGMGAAIFYPCIDRAPGNASRATCQSNLKQIGLALRQYWQDNDEQLPPHQWATSVAAYVPGEQIFQCPETGATPGTSDYFFNAHFLKGKMGDIEDPAMLIFLGEGQDDAPLDTTLRQLPIAWVKDTKSPLWRHLDGADYGFADGHVKWMKANKVSRDIEVVKP